MRQILGLIVIVTIGLIALTMAIPGQAKDNSPLICPPNSALITSTTMVLYNPISQAVWSIGQTRNFEAGVPPQCYTKTAGQANPCWTCHTAPQGMNFKGDRELQEEYSFSDVAQKNHWRNLFVDRTAAITGISDAAMQSYINSDNYSPLRASLNALADYPGYQPDFDLHQGVDEAGFARDGSQWRAIRYKPFLGTFWPTNGSTDDVFIRLPETFRQDVKGQFSQEIYKINLAILEAAITVPPELSPQQLQRHVEPINEQVAGLDLDGDGQQTITVTQIYSLPTHYVGGARQIPVTRYFYPQGTEFLHTVRYIDLNQPNLLSTRLKELRYSRKVQFLDTWSLIRRYQIEADEKDEGKLPVYSGSPLVGLRNSFGWQLQGFIEDEQGRLRLQTEEEHRFCMGCHTALGVTVDQTFAFARKVPGITGWQHQNLADIPDVPQAGHAAPEILTYFERVTGGDEFRANEEILSRFFPQGVLDSQTVLRAAPKGDQDIRFLIVPSAQRAALLNKAYMALVETQQFTFGRDAIITPPSNVHQFITNASTDLQATGKIFRDGRLWLDWSDLK